MDAGSISLLISAIVGGIQVIQFLGSRDRNLKDEIDYMKKDIIQIKIDNGICLTDRHNAIEDLKNNLRLLEKLDDKLDQL